MKISESYDELYFCFEKMRERAERAEQERDSYANSGFERQLTEAREEIERLRERVSRAEAELAARCPTCGRRPSASAGCPHCKRSG